MEDGLILAQSQYEYLLEEIHKLQARITELTALRDDLVYHVCPALRAEYDEKIVSLERELMAANMYLKQMQRTVEILQAQMNQQQKPSMEEAEAQAKKENKEYEEDLNRKAQEAREFKKKWEESQWSKHDRQEKKDREKEEQERKNKQGTDGQSETEDKDTDGNKTEDKKTDSGNGNDAENQHGDSSSESGSGTDDGPNGERADGTTGKKETTSDKIKRLYRKIVKRLHPDVHPNLTEHEKELWNRAVKAQQDGDLNQLERIWDELSGMDAPEDIFDDTPEGCAKLRELLEKLRVRMRLLELEIEHIKSDFPYKLKSFLEDPIAVEETRRGLQSKIDNVREMNRQLEAFINELREKLRKGEKL